MTFSPGSNAPLFHGNSTPDRERRHRRALVTGATFGMGFAILRDSARRRDAMSQRAMVSLSQLTQSLSELASSANLRRLWNVLRLAPGGGVLMGQLIGNLAPYTGTIRPEVLRLEEGSVQMRMRDRRAVRNHLRSVHAIALMNLGEVTTGLAVVSSLPEGMRAIITHLEMDYVKKARGAITAECHAPAPAPGERREYEVQADLTDAAGVVVARARARWLIGPAMH